MQPLRQSTARTFPSHISTAASRIARIIVEPVGAPEALYNKDHGASQEYMTRIKKEKGLPMACPNCGQPTIEGAKFCASCGSPLIQTTAAAPQAPAAPESDDGTISAAMLADRIAKTGKSARYVGDFNAIRSYLEKNCKAGDLLLTVGAGDVFKIGEAFLEN